MRCQTQINPETNRCVAKDGLIGSHIIGRPKLCDTVFNNKTSRCVLKSNMLRKSRVKTVRKKKVQLNVAKHNIDCLYVPETFTELANKCACNEKWIRRTKLGSGGFGKVYRACRYKNCEYVVKVQTNDKYARVELEAYIALQKTRLVPKLLAAWSCRSKMYLVLERLYDCKKPKIRLMKPLRDKVEKLREFGWLHCDLHWGNVMCNKSNRLVLIDFGMAVQKGKAPYKNHPRKTYTDLKRQQEEQLLFMKYESTSSS